MPNEYCDEYCNENDDNDTERRRAATFTIAVHYNRTVSHTGSCSFQLRAAVIPRPGKHPHISERNPKECGPS